jgi:hypothetical protein
MRKIIDGIFPKAHAARSKIPLRLKRKQAKKQACYVLITCGEPSDDGSMQVEMTYEGDECLAAYLIESAQGLIDEKMELPSP